MFNSLTYRGGAFSSLAIRRYYVNDEEWLFRCPNPDVAHYTESMMLLADKGTHDIIVYCSGKMARKHAGLTRSNLLITNTSIASSHPGFWSVETDELRVLHTYLYTMWQKWVVFSPANEIIVMIAFECL